MPPELREKRISREIRSLLHQNRNNPSVSRISKLHRPPETPGNVSATAPLKEILIESKVAQILGKKQLFFTLGSILRGKTVNAGSFLEASDLINQHFGLPDDTYLAWEDEQKFVKKMSFIPSNLQSGPRNTPGHYRDCDYAVSNPHYGNMIYLALTYYDFVVSDCTHLADRGEFAFKAFANHDEELGNLQFDTNGAYITAHRDIVDILHGSVGYREAAEYCPDVFTQIMVEERRHIPTEPFQVRGGSWGPSLEYMRQEHNYFAQQVRNGTLYAPWAESPEALERQLLNPAIHLRFDEEVFAPYFFSQYPLTRYSVVRNRELTDREGWPILPPPGFPILEKRNFYYSLGLLKNG